MVGEVLHDVLLARPISPVYRINYNQFAHWKDSYSFFPVEGMLITLIFFEESKTSIMLIFYRTQNTLGVLLGLNSSYR